MGEIGIWLLVNGGIIIIIILFLCVTLTGDNTSSKEPDKTNDLLEEYRKILRKSNTICAEKKVLTETDKVSNNYRKLTAEDIYSKRVKILKNTRQNNKLEITHKGFFTDIQIGVSEVYFYLNFLQYSQSHFNIYVNTEFNDYHEDSSSDDLTFLDILKVNNTNYYPDLLLLDNNGIYYDIEIDEPYSFIERAPIHYMAKDEKSNDFISSDFKRNKFFKSQGCVVVRFAEQQIFEQVEECIRYIEFISENITSMHIESIRKFSSLEKIQKWTYEDSLLLSDEDYRESYMPILKNRNKGFHIYYNDDKWMLLEANYLSREIKGKIKSTTIYEDDNKLFIRICWVYGGIPDEYGISPNSPSHWVDDIVDEDSIYLENYINKRRRKLTLVTYKALEL